MVRHRFVAMVFAVLGLAGQVSGQDRYFNAAGVKLHFIQDGAGEPVILLHGRGNTVDIWSTTGILQHLVTKYRVIAFDARGHGKSDKPHSPDAYGKEMALDAVRLMDHLGISKAHFVGYSMGGSTVGQLMTLHPERFLSATLIAGIPRFDWTEQDSRDAEMEADEYERACVSRSAILAGLEPGETAPSDEDIKARSSACFANPAQDRFAMAAMARGRRGQTVEPDEVKRTRIPTVVLVGTLDPRMKRISEIKTLRPDVELLVVDGATHGSPGDNRGILRQPITRATLTKMLSEH